MIESKNLLQSRLYLDAAKYYYQQMELSFQDRRKFLYSLLAFLPIARSVTLVFKKEASTSKQLGAWYDNQAKEWKSNKLMKFFIKLRDISIHKHTPDTRTAVSLKWVANLPALAEGDVMTVNGPDGKSLTLFPTEPRIDKIVGYHFIHNCKWFTEDSGVMNLCKKYLDELEKFVVEYENKVRGVKS
jgi:hypothetical protein